MKLIFCKALLKCKGFFLEEHWILESQWLTSDASDLQIVYSSTKAQQVSVGACVEEICF